MVCHPGYWALFKFQIFCLTIFTFESASNEISCCMLQGIQQLTLYNNSQKINSHQHNFVTQTQVQEMEPIRRLALEPETRQDTRTRHHRTETGTVVIQEKQNKTKIWRKKKKKEIQETSKLQDVCLPPKTHQRLRQTRATYTWN